MKGTILTYLPVKLYGFIEGEDGKKYFLHANELLCKSDKKDLCEQLVVEFDQAVTPKGYKAENIKIISDTESLMLELPDEFLTSRNKTVRGWEILNGENWVVCGTSTDSPDSAKYDMIREAKELGANAVTNLTYFKTTGDKPGTGSGTYYYTVHNFYGTLCNVGKKSLRGNVLHSEIIDIDKNAKQRKQALIEKSDASKIKRNFVWFILGIASLTCFMDGELLSLFWGVLCLIGIFIFGRSKNHGWWLVEKNDGTAILTMQDDPQRTALDAFSDVLQIISSR